MFFKRRKILFHYIFLLLICGRLNNGFSQKNKAFGHIDKNGIYHPKPNRYSSFSIGIGSTHYYGDISPDNVLKATMTEIRWNVALAYSYTLTKKIKVGGSIAYIRLAGDDFYSDNDLNYIRNLHFRNDLKQISLFAQYHPLDYSFDFRKRPNISPYLTAGIGFFLHNPEAKSPIGSGANWINLEPLHTEGQGINAIYSVPYKLSGLNIPIGVGIRYKYNNNIDFAFEIAYNITFTDYLDDVSGIYPNPLLLTDKMAVALSNRSREAIAANIGENRIDRLVTYLTEQGLPSLNPFIINNPVFGAIGTDRGNKIGNDSYLTTSLKVSYLLPSHTIRCPKIN